MDPIISILVIESNVLPWMEPIVKWFRPSFIHLLSLFMGITSIGQIGICVSLSVESHSNETSSCLWIFQVVSIVLKSIVVPTWSKCKIIFPTVRWIFMLFRINVKNVPIHPAILAMVAAVIFVKHRLTMRWNVHVPLDNSWNWLMIDACVFVCISLNVYMYIDGDLRLLRSSIIGILCLGEFHLSQWSMYHSTQSMWWSTGLFRWLRWRCAILL